MICTEGVKAFSVFLLYEYRGEAGEEGERGRYLCRRMRIL